jgi:purine nucleosidase
LTRKPHVPHCALPLKNKSFSRWTCAKRFILPTARYQEVKSHLRNPLFQDLFAHHWTKAAFDQDKNYYTFVWDVLTAAMLADPTLVTEARSYPVDVDTTYGPSYGQSLAFRGYGPEGTQTAKIVFSVDQDKLWKMIDNLCESL